jgi:hypothetical protein
MRSILASVATGVSASGARVSASPAVALLTASLGRGRRKAMVAVDAVLTDQAAAATSRPGVIATVNGVKMPTRSGQGTAAGAVESAFCLDLDAAEAESPGTFIGQPLRIELFGFDRSGEGFRAGMVVLRGRLEREEAPSR